MKILVIYLIVGVVELLVEYITIHCTIEVCKTSKSFRKDKYELIKRSKTKLSDILEMILWTLLWPVKVLVLCLSVYIGFTMLLVDTKKFHAMARELRVESYKDFKESA